MKIKLKIATPEKVILEDEIDQITLPTQLGEITILPNHLPLVANLKPGELLVKKAGADLPMAVSGGFMEFQNNNLTILADTAESVEEIDEIRAEEARKRAEELLICKQEAAEVDFAAISAKLEKELARLKVVRKYRQQVSASAQIKIEKEEEVE